VTAGIKNYINWLRGWISAFILQSEKKDKGAVGEYAPYLDTKKKSLSEQM